MSKKALITGITGQDAGHLAKLLHEKGYEVYATIRGQMEASHPRYQSVKAEFPYVNLVLADNLDLSALTAAMNQIKPDEVYNLAAQSHVQVSFETAEYTANADGVGPLRITNRSHDRADRLAEAYGAVAVPFDQLDQALSEVDIEPISSATSSLPTRKSWSCSTESSVAPNAAS